MSQQRLKKSPTHFCCSLWLLLWSWSGTKCLVPTSTAFSLAPIFAGSFLQQQQQQQLPASSLSSFELRLQKGWFVPDDDDDEHDEGGNNGLVTKEMLLRDMLADPQVRRKKGKGQGYKPLDNRDHLPFAVKQITPDPYTRPEVKKQRQHKSKVKKSDLELQLMSSRLVTLTNESDEDNDVSTLLGEYQLDKTTTSGDIIVLGHRHYKVERARCQYKYAGGQRFVMCRKILEVKEITRSIQEAELERQLAATPRSRSSSSSSSSMMEEGATGRSDNYDDNSSSCGSNEGRD